MATIECTDYRLLVNEAPNTPAFEPALPTLPMDVLTLIFEMSGTDYSLLNKELRGRYIERQESVAKEVSQLRPLRSIFSHVIGYPLESSRQLLQLKYKIDKLYQLLSQNGYFSQRIKESRKKEWDHCDKTLYTQWFQEQSVFLSTLPLQMRRAIIFHETEWKWRTACAWSSLVMTIVATIGSTVAAPDDLTRGLCGAGGAISLGGIVYLHSRHTTWSSNFTSRIEQFLGQSMATLQHNLPFTF